MNDVRNEVLRKTVQEGPDIVVSCTLAMPKELRCGDVMRSMLPDGIVLFRAFRELSFGRSDSIRTRVTLWMETSRDIYNSRIDAGWSKHPEAMNSVTMGTLSKRAYELTFMCDPDEDMTFHLWIEDTVP